MRIPPPPPPPQVATAIAFGTPMTPIGITGSAIAMVGVLIYSLVEQAYSKKK